MSTETVQVDWVDDHVFLLRDRNGFPIVMTQPNGANGSDLLTLSLIGCAAWDIITILQKQRQGLTQFAATADTQRDDEPPWRIRKIRIHYKFTGHNLKAEAIERAIALSETRYCSIFATLREAVDIQSDYEIIAG